jgi:hypothetical protein
MALPREPANLNGTRQLRDEEGAIALSIAKRLLLCLVSKSLLTEDEALSIIARAVDAETRH